MKKSFVLTIILVIVVAVFAALIFGTNLGSNEDNPQTLKQISFSPKTTTNTISVVDNQMLYQSIEIDSSTFSILDLATGKTIDIGTIANYIMDSGSSVVIEDSIYTYITTSDENRKPQNDLYRIEHSNLELEKISTDKKSAPIISLYQTPTEILALKTDGTKTYFEKIDVRNGDAEEILVSPSGETFVTADVVDATLFVFAYSTDSNGDYQYFIRKYTLNGYKEVGLIKLDNIKEYISKARIADMEIMGNYFYLINYSGIGIIGEINDDDTVSKTHEISDLTYLTSDEDSGTSLFYVRKTNTYYIFDNGKGELTGRELTFKNGYTIRTMFSDDENVVVKTKADTENKIDRYHEEIYVFRYDDLISKP